MSPEHDPNWRCAGHCVDGGPFVVDGVDLFQHPWVRVSADPVTVKDLHDPIFKSLPIYEVTANDKRILFVAGQFRWDTTTFFLPATRPQPT